MKYLQEKYMKKFLVLVSFAAILQNCGRSNDAKNHRVEFIEEAKNPKKNPSNSSSNATVKKVVSTAAENSNQIREALVDYGFRDFSQIYYTMASVTGIDPNTPALKSAYQAQLLSLPAPGNDIKSFAAAHQSAIFKLGVEFCHALIESPDLRSSAFPNFAFTAELNKAFAGPAKKNLALALINQFWGAGLSNRPDYNAASDTVVGLIEEIIADTGSLNSIPQEERTRNVAKGACVAVLTALPTNVL